MNKVILHGRLTRDPIVKYTDGKEPCCIARFTVVCTDKERKKDVDGNYPANYIPCVCMGKLGEIVEANFAKGKEVIVSGKMQSGSYKNQNQEMVYTLDCFVQEIEYCGKKGDSPVPYDNSFMNIPPDLEAEMPFK